MLRNARWEQCYDPKTDTFFYYNKETDETTWDRPREPFKPAGYWPKPKLLRQGVCSVCRERTATHVCEQCIWDEEKEEIDMDPYGGYGFIYTGMHIRQREFCFRCYAVHHSTTKELRQHTFVPIDEVAVASLQCSECNEPMTRFCDDCDEAYCDNCFPEFHNK